MPSHGQHILLFAVSYFVFLGAAFSWCSHQKFQEAFRSLRSGRQSNPRRWSNFFAVVIAASLPLFIIELFRI